MPYKMHPRFLILCLVGLMLWPFVSCQYTGYKCENTCIQNITGSDGGESTNFPTDSETSSSSTSDYVKESVDGSVGYLDFLNRIWNSDRVLKLNVFKSEHNDTLVNVRFSELEPHELFVQENEVGRTFGIRRRMQLFLWLPISFKLGVIVTLLLVLTTMSLKTLLIGFIILLLLLTHTNGHAKLWGTQRVAELSDRNVHIHVHTLPEDQHQAFVKPWHGLSQSPVYHE